MTQRKFCTRRTALPIVLAFGFLGVGLLAGCGGGGGGSSNGSPGTGGGSAQGTAAVSVAVLFPATQGQAQTISNARSVVIRLADSGGNFVTGPQTVMRPAAGGSASTTFTGLAPGTLNLTATAYGTPDGSGAALGAAIEVVQAVAGGVTAARPLTVSGQIAMLSLIPALPVTAAKSLTLIPTATDAAGDLDLIAPGQLTWNSDAPGVATVDASGDVSGVTAGTAHVKVTDPVSGLSATTLVTVTATFTRRFTSLPLGNLGGGLTVALGINNSGQVIGYSSIPGSPVTLHAFESSAGALLDLTPTPALTNSQAFGINAAGQVVGQFRTTDGTNHAFLYSGGALTDLNQFLGATASVANGISPSGQVVGSFTSSGSGTQAFLYDSASAGSGYGGQVTFLQEFLGGLRATTSVANGINASRQIVGSFTVTGSMSPHAFLISSNATTDLNPLLGAASSAAVAVNAGGKAVGSFDPGSGLSHAFLYDSGTGTVTDLNTLLGATASVANGINMRGQVVGNFTTPSGAKHAFLYDTNGTVTDLNPFVGGPNSDATGINDSGQICATSSGGSGSQSQALVLTPQ